ncbi:MAG: SRPBCC family protein [Labedaea sp.]
MSRIQIDATERTAAGAATVYALLRTGATWPDWSPIDSFELEREGADEPEGVGAVRIFRNGRITGHDEITGLTENRSFRYAHRSTLPVRDYRGEIGLTPAGGGGTVIHWRVSFRPKIPGTGWLLRRGLTTFVGELTRGLARHATAVGDPSVG